MKRSVEMCTIVLLCISLILSGCDRGIERIYSGQISGVNGGTIKADNLTITFPRGIASANINITIDKDNGIPEIKGTEEQKQAYKKLRFIGPIYKITASQKQFSGSFLLMVKFDPAEFDRLMEGEILYVISISDDGIATFPKVVDSDFRKGVITVESSHFSFVSVIAASPPLMAALILGVSAGLFIAAYIANARNNPWQFIQPDDDSIRNYIASNHLRLPVNRSNDGGFTMEGFNKRFAGERDPWIIKRPFSGPETLKQDYVLCWDLVTLYGSILANMAQRPDETGINGDRIRFVMGTDHTWIEIVIAGRVYVVDTTSLKKPFRFIPLEKAYKDSGLRPKRMYALQPGSLTDYDANWYLRYIRAAPPPRSSTVVGDSIWNTPMGRMTLSQQGKVVSGTIGPDYKIKAESNGNYIRGFIIYPSGFLLNFEIWISADGNSFTGNQGMSSNPEFKGDRIR